MESFYEASSGPVESFIDNSAFNLVSLNLPRWYINADLKVTCTPRSNWDKMVIDYPLTARPGLDSVLSAGDPPDLDFFRLGPQPTKDNEWAVYTVLCEHLSDPDEPPILYVGSGTNAENGFATGAISIRFFNEGVRADLLLADEELYAKICT